MIITLNESLFIRQISICVWIKCHLAIVEINLEMWECFVGERGAAYLWLENGGEKKKVVFKVRDWRSWMTTLISISSKHSLVLWGHLVWLLCCKGASCIIRRLLPCSKKTQALQAHEACVTPGNACALVLIRTYNTQVAKLSKFGGGGRADKAGNRLLSHNEMICMRPRRRENRTIWIIIEQRSYLLVYKVV